MQYAKRDPKADGPAPLLRSSAASSDLELEKNMASGYDYREVQSTAQEIRVLHLDPSCRIGKRTRLRCDLKHISLSQVPVPRYVAVSYCWGTGEERAPIVIDGQRATIPRTAADALRNLSRVACEAPLWIDAVSIDQYNLLEKSEQVSMMKDVYSLADAVLIWLGPAGKHTAAAIASIDKIYRQCLRATDDLEHLQDHLYGTDGSTGFKYSSEPLPDCDWLSLRSFYAAPWFSRLWVIQEIGLARNATVVVGPFSVGAEKVVLAERWIVHRKYPRYYGGQEMSGVESASNMYRPADRPLFNQLRRTHRARCTKPQDRIYGLLGLLREQTAARIVSSYTRPLVEVYAQTVRLALHECGDLSFLQFVAWYKSPQLPTTRTRRLIQRASCGLWG
jgi:hypothetical protein